MSKQVLTATDICKSYGKKIALDNVTFDLRRAEIHSLLGPNGAGKTTLIKILATLLNKDSGYVNILGYDLDKDENNIRHVLGYVGQDTERSAYARLTPVENLRFFGALRGLSKDHIDEKIGQFSKYIEFEENLNKQFMHLSGGQKQVVVIMRALLHDPPIIFLDEPTKGLDPIIAKKIRLFLKQYSEDQNKSVLLTSHILTEVDEMADRVSLIHGGKIKITDSPHNLKSGIGVSDFIELKKDELPTFLIDEIQNLDVITGYQEKDKEWISFGVSDLFLGTESIIDLLRKNDLKVGFRHHSVTLEDAFIHRIGVLEEGFD
ncbi:MAG: ABC transporter ATP-binding protein [Candidatus Heimdallarchaeota archaeon]|nr:ABC transporter ATP-binding protein [Candidatus Heimdallarchaeota archaeon]